MLGTSVHLQPGQINSSEKWLEICLLCMQAPKIISKTKIKAQRISNDDTKQKAKPSLYKVPKIARGLCN